MIIEKDLQQQERLPDELDLEERNRISKMLGAIYVGPINDVGNTLATIINKEGEEETIMVNLAGRKINREKYTKTIPGKDIGDPILVKLKDGKYRFLLPDGSYLENLEDGKIHEFGSAYPFDGQYARIRIKTEDNKQYERLIRKDGQFASGSFREIYPPSCGISKAILDTGEVVYINSKTGKIIRDDIESGREYSDDGTDMPFVVIRKRGKDWFMDKNGHVRYDLGGFESAKTVRNGISLVRIDGLYRLLNLNDGSYIKLENGSTFFDNANSFSEGFTGVEKNGQWYIIDKSGKIIKSGLKGVRSFHEGYCIIDKGDGIYLINTDGTEIAGPYTDINGISDGFFAFKAGYSEWRIRKIDGTTLPGIFHDAGKFKNGVMKVAIKKEDGSVWGAYINKKGESVFTPYKL